MMSMNETSPGHFEIRLDESFDFESHKEFREFIKSVMSSNPQKLSISFTDVEYIDSSALGMLMLAKHESEQKGCDLALTNLKDGHAKNVLQLVKFDQMFTIENA